MKKYMYIYISAYKLTHCKSMCYFILYTSIKKNKTPEKKKNTQHVPKRTFYISHKHIQLFWNSVNDTIIPLVIQKSRSYNGTSCNNHYLGKTTLCQNYVNYIIYIKSNSPQPKNFQNTYYSEKFYNKESCLILVNSGSPIKLSTEWFFSPKCWQTN